MEQTQVIPPTVANRFKGLARMIGNTPPLAVEFLYRGRKRVIYAKSEQLNMTGSIKDRMAIYILQRAYARGEIRPGDSIVEAASGKTGISFACWAIPQWGPVPGALCIRTGGSASKGLPPAELRAKISPGGPS